MVLVLGPPTLHAKTLIVLLMVVIFSLSHSRDYPYMIHLNKDRYYHSLYQIQYNYFSGDGDGRGSSGTNSTNLYHKVDFGRYRYDVMFFKYQNHYKEFPMVTSFSKYYSVSAAVGSSFVVAAGDGKIILIPRTIYLTSQKIVLLDLWW